MNEAEFRQLVGDATDYLRACIARARQEFGIGEFERKARQWTTATVEG